jgi:uncharacterized protein
VSKGWRKFHIQNRRGQMLAALLREADAGGGPGRSSPALVIVCHGFTGAKEGGGRALEMGEALARRGFHTLLFDFAGCGESEGAWEEVTLSRHLDDLADVVEWSRVSGHKRIILNGRSFGGAAALCCAARDDRIAAVCTWAAPADLIKLFNGFIKEAVTGPPLETIALTEAGGSVSLRKLFFYDLPRHNILGCAAHLSPRPLLVIHGGADETVPTGDAAVIYAAAGEPKQLVVIDGADHRFSNHIGPVWETFFQWLDNL